MNRRAVIITGPGFQDHDVVYTYYRLLGTGYHVDIATKGGKPVQGKYGLPLPLDKMALPLIAFEALSVESYDLVVCPGGHEAPDRVRQDPTVLAFIKEMAEAKKVVAGLCHGPWIMISAGVMRGRRACAYVGMKDDMVNAGANVIKAAVVVDGSIITCSYYAHVEAFMKVVLEEVERHLHVQSEAVSS
jgi:protease I